MLVNGLVQDTRADPLAALATVILNAGRLALVLPSVTTIPMLENVAMLLVDGVPDKLPLEVLKDAQLGLLEIVNVSFAPEVAVTVGVNP